MEPIYIPLRLENVSTGVKQSLRKPVIVGNRYRVNIQNRVVMRTTPDTFQTVTSSLKCVLNIVRPDDTSALSTGITTTEVPQNTEVSLGEFDVSVSDGGASPSVNTSYLMKLLVANTGTTITKIPVYKVEVPLLVMRV